MSEVYLGLVLIGFCIWQTWPYLAVLFTHSHLVDLETGLSLSPNVIITNLLMNGAIFPAIVQCGWQLLLHGMMPISPTA